MAPCSLLPFHVLCYFPFLLLAQSGIKQKYYGNCPLYSQCGNFGDIYFPFSNTTSSECGLPIRGCDNSGKKAEVQLANQIWCEVENFSRPESRGPDLLIVQDKELKKHLPKNCSDFDHDIPPPPSPSLKIFQIANIITLHRCNRSLNLNFPESFFSYTKCPYYDIYYTLSEDGNFDQYFPTSSCSKIQVPFDPEYFLSPKIDDPFKFMTSKLDIKVNLPQKCVECYKTGDIRSDDEGVFYCSKVSTPAAAKDKPRIWKVMIGLGVGCLLIAILIIGCLIGHRLHKRKHTPLDVVHPESNDTFADPDPESGNVYFRVPLFSYEELQEATKNFDREREIGAGGFGTVY